MLDTLSADQLATICKGQWYLPPTKPFVGAQIDSRAMQIGDLFIALKGTHTDGHAFIPSLKAEAGHGAVVSQPNKSCKIPQLAVHTPQTALQDLARQIAATTPAQKIAITGSVGKTGTKNMLGHCLSPLLKTHATKGNLNNDIGAPLTILRAPSDADVIICEMGMNHAGEIAFLSKMLTPHISIITRIADAHTEHFSSIADIARAKAEIFEGMSPDGLAILPADDPHFALLRDAARQAGITNILRFGSDAACELRLVRQQPHASGQMQAGQMLDVVICGEALRLQLGMTAPHWGLSALICLGIAAHLGLSLAAIATKLADMADLAGRGARFVAQIGSHRAAIIDDAYNAGPASMQAALSVLASHEQSPNLVKAAILSDMLELGADGPVAHDNLAKHIAAAGVSDLLLIGPMMRDMARHLPAHIAITYAMDAADARLAADALASKANLLLIKGSHGSGAWQLADHLRTFEITETPDAT